MFIMRVLPRTIDKQIAFFETRVPLWSQDPEALGLSGETVEQIKTLTDEARAAYQAAVAARNAAQSATLLLRSALEKLRKPGAAAVATIKAKASTMDDNSIYASAHIDPPNKPGAAPDLGTPRNVSVVISSAGCAVVTWEGTGPTGTARGRGSRGGGGLYYSILRQGPGEAMPRVVGATGERSFADQQPPLVPGATLVYFVQACRGARHSPLSVGVAIGVPTLPAAMAPQVARRAA